MFLLTQRVEKQEREIKEIRQELKDVMAIVQKLYYEQRRAQEREADAQRILLLEIENKILQAKLSLPPSSTEK